MPQTAQHSPQRRVTPPAEILGLPEAVADILAASVGPPSGIRHCKGVFRRSAIALVATLPIPRFTLLTCRWCRA